MQEDWHLLVSLLPRDWLELALQTGALKGLRKDQSPEHLLRALLLHLGCGYSLHESAVKARRAGLANLSVRAFGKRLAKSRDWLHALCVESFREWGLEPAPAGGMSMRAIDVATIKELDEPDSLWRLDYSMRLPSLECDYIQLTAMEGVGASVKFARIPVQAGDYLLANRDYTTAAGLGRVDAAGGRMTVPVNPGSLRFQTAGGQPFDLLAAVRTLRRAGSTRAWTVRAIASHSRPVPGRVCALRKTGEAIRFAHRALRQEASSKDPTAQSHAWEFAKYVIVFTTFPASHFPAERVLECYRLRWQVELVLGRFKSLVAVGDLPERDDDSAKTWLYGKLLVVLLVEKLIRYASAASAGDTARHQHLSYSAWSDFSFFLNQVQRVIEPPSTLARTLAEWDEISEALADEP